MKSLILALGLTAIATQSVALSCMEPDPVLTFQQLSEVPEPYILLYGQLRFDPAALPQGVRAPDAQDSQPPAVTAMFSGKSLTLDGFTADYAGPVTLQVTCLGPWCGGTRSGTDALIFAQVDTAPALVSAPPCGGRIFLDPTPQVLDTMTQCLRGGACLP